MKNFKRVISAVIALALSASTLVAVSASKFADVDGTNYAEAIEVLTALDIAHGYDEEGGLVFKPEGEITRAEAATLIVGALNMMNDAKAAAGASKFTDVNEQASWATGYVNVGVAQGFINGMDDTTFAPQQNVTYAQMCVMLTLITGYGDFAKANGGYPTGYTQMAASTGISKGVAAGADTPLKRGQVAQMLYNAMVTPVLGVKSYSLNGGEYAVADGEGSDSLAFKTLLSSKFNGYEAEVVINDTPKSADLAKGKIKVSLNEDTHLDESKDKTAENKFRNKEIYDDFGADEYLYMTGKAILTKDANKEWHLVYFAAGDNDMETVDAADYKAGDDDGKNIDSAKKITFGSKNYDVNTNGQIYVNGKPFGDISEANAKNILGRAQGEVKLIDDDDDAKGYDKIMVTVYDIAQVSAVSYTNETTTISLKGVTEANCLNTGITGFEFDDEDLTNADYAITVKNAEGENIKLSSIKKDDVIAYAKEYDKEENGVINPTVIDIIVTDKTVTGVVSGRNSTDETYTIDGEAYEETSWEAVELKLKTTYTVSLDPFGRIFAAEVVATGSKYAIAESYSTTDKELELVLPDGSIKRYEVSATTVKDNANILSEDTFSKLTAYINNETKPAVQNRVIKYTIKNSTGKIDSIETVAADKAYDDTAAVYKDKTGKLGNYSIVDGTAILNVQDYVENKNNDTADYKTFAASSFVDKAEYEGYVFVDNKAAALILLTKVGTQITADSRFAVAVTTPEDALTENDDLCYSATVLYDGQEQEMLFNRGYKGTVKQGDVFFFLTDSDGLVTDVDVVYSTPAKADGLFNKTFAPKFATFTTESKKWDFTIKNENNYDNQLVYGIITDVDSKGVEFTQVDAVDDSVDTKTILDLRTDAKTEYYELASDCATYSFAINKNTNNLYKSFALGAPTASTIDAYEVNAETGNAESKTEYFNLKAGADKEGMKHLTYAFAEIIDGDIVAIYTIVQ